MSPHKALARLILASMLLPGIAAADEISLNARPVPLAEELPLGAHSGRIRFLGMLALPRTTIDGLRFAQISDLAWDNDDGVLYALSDKGALFHLRPIFNGGMLADVKVKSAVALREPQSEQTLRRKRADSEGLAVVYGRNGRVHDAELIVSFEHIPRIMRYRPDGRALAQYPLPPMLADPRGYQNDNLMLEAVCVDPKLGILTIPEAPLRSDPQGFNRIYNLSGLSWLYPVERENRVVGLACLGDGEVLVLERDYGRLFWRSLVALKRVQLSRADAGTTLNVETIAVLDSRQGFQIDNFEGIAHHRENRFFLISDDNDLFIQRTLLLYLELLAE